MAAPFDTLKLARTLRDRAGFSREHAEAVVEQVATKQGVADLRNGMKAESTAVRSEIDALRTEMQAPDNPEPRW